MSTTEPSSERFAARLDEAIVGCAFSGVVRIHQGGHVVSERAAGFADRRWSVPMKATTRLSTASATKGFTALAVMSLVESGELRLDTSARALLGTDLPLIDDDVTIEHLLGHRSGIGDYLDEETLGDISDHAMPVPVHQLDSTEAYLSVLGGFPQGSAAGGGVCPQKTGGRLLWLVPRRGPPGAP